MSKKKITAPEAFVSLLSIAVGMALGYFVFGASASVENGNDATSSVKAICDKGFVSRYNDATLYKVRGEDAQPSMDSAALKALSSEVKAKEGYDGDPTCQAIVFWSAVEESDYNTATSAYDAIIRLNDQRKFIDNNMRITVPLFDYESVLGVIAPSNDNNTEGNGGL